MTITRKKEPVMNRTTKLALAALAAAFLSGCATTQTHDGARTDAAAPMEKQVSRPAAYGSMGGYRYRRLVSITITSG
jgi:hypothetical protein